MDKNLIKDYLNLMPEGHGIYLMKNNKDAILYVGKSVNLRSRIKFHLCYSLGKKELLLETDKIEIIMTDSEEESLVLEAKIINEFTPKYNKLKIPGRMSMGKKNFTPLLYQLWGKGKGSYKIPGSNNRSSYQELIESFIERISERPIP